MNRFARTFAGLLAAAALVGGAGSAITASDTGATDQGRVIVLADGADHSEGAFDWE